MSREFCEAFRCTQGSENGEDCDEVNDDDTGGGNGEANKHTQNMFRQAFNDFREHYVLSLSKILRSRTFTLQYTLVVCIMIQISVLQCFANLGKGQIASAGARRGGGCGGAFSPRTVSATSRAFAECSRGVVLMKTQELVLKSRSSSFVPGGGGCILVGESLRNLFWVGFESSCGPCYVYGAIPGYFLARRQCPWRIFTKCSASARNCWSIGR